MAGHENEGAKRRHRAVLSLSGGYGLESRERPEYFERLLHLKSKKEFNDFFQSQSVLDLGASGKLALSKVLKNRRIKVKELVALSPAFGEDVWRRGAQEIKKKGKFKTTLVAAMGEALPFIDGAFSRVVATHVLEHLDLEQAKAVIKESARMLPDKGIACFSPVRREGDRILIRKEGEEMYESHELPLSEIAKALPGVTVRLVAAETPVGPSESMAALFIEKPKKKTTD